jgi:hypothetical protein
VYEVPRAEIDKTLKAWPAQPTAAQRRHLAALFLAASDRGSAWAQWLQLPADERRTGDGVDEELLTQLQKIQTSNNENYRIAAVLAARLGLQRLHAVDNHTGDNTDLRDSEAFGAAIQGAWNSGHAKLEAEQKEEAELSRQNSLLPLYRHINRPQNLKLLAETNVATAMRFKSEQHYPQIWVAGWEVRNLRMVANIRKAFHDRPEARVLSIVGVSHKPWFDSWLGQLSGIDIVDAEKVLK